jgi:beta-carotene 3-hydroxylase
MNLLLGVLAFVAMEPVTYLVHRFVMHGPGMRWHASHHGPRRGRLERNDLYPVVFGLSTFALMALGATVPALAWLLPVGVGISAYGIAYLLVHDVYAHRRLWRFQRRLPVLERLATDHRLHHRDGGEPYGFLVPIVVASRRRATRR